MIRLLATLVLFFAGCATARFPGPLVPMKRSEVVGTYSAPILVTWVHRYVLREDGSAEYEVTYDSFAELPDGSFQTGHSYRGEWHLVSATEVTITFPRKDKKIVPFVLRSISVKGRPALLQVSPEVTVDGYAAVDRYTYFLFFKEEPNQSPEPTPTAGTSAAEQPLVPAAGVAHL